MSENGKNPDMMHDIGTPGFETQWQKWMERSQALIERFERLGSFAENFQSMAVIMFLELIFEDDPVERSRLEELIKDCCDAIREISEKQKATENEEE